MTIYSLEVVINSPEDIIMKVLEETGSEFQVIWKTKKNSNPLHI